MKDHVPLREQRQILACLWPGMVGWPITLLVAAGVLLTRDRWSGAFGVGMFFAAFVPAGLGTITALWLNGRLGRHVRAYDGMICMRCGHVLPADKDAGVCAECGRPWEAAHLRAYWQGAFD